MFRALAAVGLVAAAAVLFALVVRPAQVESASHAAVVENPPPAAGTPAYSGQGERKRLEDALASLRATPATRTPPAGIEERNPGVFGGRISWSEVQGFLAWAASQKGAVESIEVQAVPDDRDRAECRLVLAPREPR